MNFDQIFINFFGLLLTSSLGEFTKTTKIHVWWVGSSIHDCSSSFSVPFFYAPSILALIPQFSLPLFNLASIHAYFPSSIFSRKKMCFSIGEKEWGCKKCCNGDQCCKKKLQTKEEIESEMEIDDLGMSCRLKERRGGKREDQPSRIEKEWPILDFEKLCHNSFGP